MDKKKLKHKYETINNDEINYYLKTKLISSSYEFNGYCFLSPSYYLDLGNYGFVISSWLNYELYGQSAMYVYSGDVLSGKIFYRYDYIGKEDFLCAVKKYMDSLKEILLLKEL